MTTKSVLIDLDGTLTDSKPGIVACIRHALLEMDARIDPQLDLEPFIGPPLRGVFSAILGPGADTEKAVAFYRQRFTETGMFENSLYQGIEDCLRSLKQRDCRLYVATSKPAVYARRIIAHFEMADYFEAIYGAGLDGRLGDKTELIGHIVSEQRLDATQTVMIGDRKYDMIGARSNRVFAIGALWGYGSEAELREAGAELLCPTPQGLADLVTG